MDFGFNLTETISLKLCHLLNKKSVDKGFFFSIARIMRVYNDLPSAVFR